jgi:hypothetical protein
MNPLPPARSRGFGAAQLAAYCGGGGGGGGGPGGGLDAAVDAAAERSKAGVAKVGHFTKALLAAAAATSRRRARRRRRRRPGNAERGALSRAAAANQNVVKTRSKR